MTHIRIPSHRLDPLTLRMFARELAGAAKLLTAKADDWEAADRRHAANRARLAAALEARQGLSQARRVAIMRELHATGCTAAAAAAAGVSRRTVQRAARQATAAATA